MTGARKSKKSRMKRRIMIRKRIKSTIKIKS